MRKVYIKSRIILIHVEMNYLQNFQNDVIHKLMKIQKILRKKNEVDSIPKLGKLGAHVISLKYIIYLNILH